MDQFHYGVEGCKTTLLFNGLIDAEPVVHNTGVGTMTQDPKVEVRSVTNPDLAETWVTLHFRSDTTGVLGVSGTALAGGVPILIDFPTLGEWIAPPQATANAVAARTASEALA